MVTLAKEEQKQRFWSEYWAVVVGSVFVISVVGLLVWAVISFYEDRAEDIARIEATKFDISGVIEGTREEHAIFEDGLLGFSRKVDYFYVSIHGVEYKVNWNLKNYEFLKTGQKVKVSGQEGEIDAVSISK